MESATALQCSPPSIPEPQAPLRRCAKQSLDISQSSPFRTFSGLRCSRTRGSLSAQGSGEHELSCLSSSQYSLASRGLPVRVSTGEKQSGASRESAHETSLLEAGNQHGTSSFLSTPVSSAKGGITIPQSTLAIPYISNPPTLVHSVKLIETAQSNSPRLKVPPLPKVSPESLQYEPGFLGGISGKTLPLAGEKQDLPAALSYLTRILSSKVYDVAIESPLDTAVKLSERTGVRILLKREDLQSVFSFKLRGAYNMMAKLPKDQLAQGVICSSAGNHAQGVALAAQKLDCDAVIAMPVTTPEIKWKSVKRLGATVVLVGDSYDETQSYARQRAQEEGRVFIPPFDHPDVIAGQGTIGMEIVRQHPGPLHAVFVPVGGGGLIAGIAAYMKRVRPEVRIIGVEPVDANAMALSLYNGERVMLDQAGVFADGVAVKCVGEETFNLCRELVDGIVLVSRDAICAAIKDMFEETRSILEPAGALALAGAAAYCKYYGLKDETVIAVTSGANMNFDRLRVVTELADVGACKEAVIATFMPEQPGSFKSFIELVGPMNITEFKYRYDDSKDKALVLCSVGLHKEEELNAMKNRLEFAGLDTLDLTDNDLAKDHLRHLMGGRARVKNELLYRFMFPERPGALLKFLNAFSPQWNITLFHYRRQGEMGANILVGMQSLGDDEEELVACARALGYEYRDEHSNEAFHLIMR